MGWPFLRAIWPNLLLNLQIHLWMKNTIFFRLKGMIYS